MAYRLFAELKRRNVLRAGAIYAAAVWALAQGIAQLGPSIGLPDWTTRWFLVASIIGFPFWIAFAWFYAFTPRGLKRESEIAPDDAIAHSSGRKLDFWIIGIMAVAIVLLVTNQFVLRRDATSTAKVADTKALSATLAKLSNKSVAVLPLTNEGGDPKQQYFSDGLSEELISDLAKINGLKVISKYSSFKFRDSKDSPAQIGAALGVAHLLQGSVRQIGDHLRVMVTLIAAEDGAVVWSHTYDQELKDVFAIQTQIGEAVAGALKMKLLGQALGIDDKPPSGNVEAYKLMLQGRSLARRFTEADIRQSIALYQQALKLDPNYAYAWGVLSNAWVNLSWKYLNDDAKQQAYADARAAIDREQALAPDAASTHVDRGYLITMVDLDPKRALAEYQRAYALAPSDGGVMSALAYGYANTGQLQRAVELTRRALATDPLRVSFYANLASLLLVQGQLDSAAQTIRSALALQPDYPELYLNLATIDMARGQLDAAEQGLRKWQALQPSAPGLYANQTIIDILRGDVAAAVRDAKQETDPVLGPWIRAMAQQIRSDRKQADAALHDYIANYSKSQPYNVADLYALRKQPDDMFEWLQRAWSQHRFDLINYLLSDPFVLPYQHDPRFVALCKQAGLPLPGQVLPGDSAVAAGATP